jgi:hypothetical protein
MNFTDKIKAAAEIAKSRTNDKRWINAIDRAVAESSTWIVTEHVGFTLVTTNGGTYRVTAHHCNCKSGSLNRPCKHASFVRLSEIAETIKPAPTKEPRIVRSIERDHFGVRHVVERCDGWMI